MKTQKRIPLLSIKGELKTAAITFEKAIKEIAYEVQRDWINPFCDKYNVSFVIAGNRFMFVKCRAGIEGYGLPAEITEKPWETPPEDYAVIYEILTIMYTSKSCLFECMENYYGQNK